MSISKDMDISKFKFLKQAEFYKKKENVDFEKIVSLLEKPPKKYASKIAGKPRCFLSSKEKGDIRYCFLAFMKEGYPSLFSETDGLDKSWRERKLAYILVAEKEGYVAVCSKNMPLELKRDIEKDLEPIDNDILSKIVLGKTPVFKKICMENLDVSKNALHRKTLEADDLESSYSFFNSGGHLLNSFRAKNSGDSKFSGTYSMIRATSKINFLYQKGDFPEFCEWLEKIFGEIREIKGNPIMKQNRVLSLFAERVVKLDEISNLDPVFVVIHENKIEEFLEREELEICGKGKSRFWKEICAGGFNRVDSEPNKFKKIEKENISIDLTRKEKRFEITSGEFNKIKLRKIYASNEEWGTLQDLINVGNCFTVCFAGKIFRYANGQFVLPKYSPNDWESFLDIFVDGGDDLEKTTSEKGENELRKGDETFPKTSIFGFVENKFRKDFDYFICDDMGNEWADHIGLSKDRIALFAEKSCSHKDGEKFELSASRFHDLVSQAEKNLGVFKRPTLKKNKFEKWSGDWTIEKGPIAIKRLRKGELPSLQKDWEKAMTSHNLRKELYLVVNFLSKSLLEKKVNKIKNLREGANKKGQTKGGNGNRNLSMPVIENTLLDQILWLMMSLNASCRELGVTLKVYCPK